MKKVIVIGCPGSGKTIFAEKLNKYTGLPLFHLDAIWHKPDRTHISRDEYDQRLAEILELEAWIIDGNYSRTIENFPEKNLPRIYELIEKYKEGKQFIIFKSRSQADEYLNKIR